MKTNKLKKGYKLGELTILGPHRRKSWIVKCDCGNKIILHFSEAKSRKSCGRCGVIRIRHGMKGTRFYRIWKGINGRCYTESNRAYVDYGAKGIGSEWRMDFLQFKRDMYKSYLEHVQKHGEADTTIDRIDSTKGYCRNNCRWATQLEQANNKSNNTFVLIGGIKKTMPQWSRATGINLRTLWTRYSRDGKRGNDLIEPIPNKDNAMTEEEWERIMGRD